MNIKVKHPSECTNHHSEIEISLEMLKGMIKPAKSLADYVKSEVTQDYDSDEGQTILLVGER